MFSYDYNICATRLRVNTPWTLWVEPQSEAFAAPPGPVDADVTLEAVPVLSPPPGMCCSANREKPVWRDGPRIWRGDHDLFRPQMHFCTAYSLDAPSHLTGQVREEDWRWATRSKYLWPGIMLHYILLHRRGLIFHASYIGCEGQGILFTAPSGTGKSTQAGLWQQYRGARIYNGDKAGVTLRDAPMAHGVPFSGTSGICENVSLPLRAIVVLSQAPENRIRRLPPSEAVAALCPNLFVDQAVPEEWSLALNLLLDLTAAVPIYALACTPDERAVAALEAALFPHSH